MGPIVTIAILLTSLAGIVTSLTLLWVKVGRPFTHFCKRAAAVVDAMSDLPEWCESVDQTMEACKKEVISVKAMIEDHTKNHHSSDSNNIV